MGDRRYGEETVSPRMVLNSANNATFEAFVVKPRPLVDLQAALVELRKHDRNRRLLEAATYCQERISNLAANEGHSQCAEHILAIVNFLNERSPVVSLTVDDEGTAFTIFETLNDRGMDLSPLDLVKNHMFRCIGNDANRQRDLEARWTQMMSNLEEVAPDQFLKAFWTSRHGRVQTHTLFKDFTEKHANVTSSIEVSINMLTAAERYSALSNPEDPIWAPYSDAVRECVQSLRTLGSKQTHPVIMSALDRFDERQVERLMRMLEVLIVRYQFVGGGRTGALEIECARIAKRIFQGQVDLPPKAVPPRVLVQAPPFGWGVVQEAEVG